MEVTSSDSTHERGAGDSDALFNGASNTASSTEMTSTNPSGAVESSGKVITIEGIVRSNILNEDVSGCSVRLRQILLVTNERNTYTGRKYSGIEGLTTTDSEGRYALSFSWPSKTLPPADKVTQVKFSLEFAKEGYAGRDSAESGVWSSALTGSGFYVERAQLEQGLLKAVEPATINGPFGSISFRTSPVTSLPVQLETGYFSRTGQFIHPDSSGVYHAFGVCQSGDTARLEMKGYVPMQFDVPAFKGDKTNVEVVKLNRGKTVTGKVVDENGRAVKDVYLRLSHELPRELMYDQIDPKPNDPYNVNVEAISAEDGTFAMSGISTANPSSPIPTSKRFYIYAQTLSDTVEPYMNSIVLVTCPALGEADPVTITVKPAGEVIGKFVSSNKPGSIELHDVSHFFFVPLDSSDKPMLSRDDEELYQRVHFGSFSCFVKPDGSFTRKGLPVGNYMLYWGTSGHQLYVHGRVKVSGGQETAISVDGSKTSTR